MRQVFVKTASPRVAGPLRHGSLARLEPTALGGLRRSLARFRHLRGLTVVYAVVVIATTGARAQTTGTVRGQVANPDGQPVVEATVTLVSLGSTGARHETSTDETGHFQQTGLPAGQYSVSAVKDELGDQIFRVVVHPAGSVAVHFVLRAGQTAAPWLRAAQDDQAATAAFAAGVRANRVGDFADAIEQFETALRLRPTCVDCYFNIGVSQSRLNRFAEAETAYHRALQIRSDYAPAYYGLADVLNKQNRTEEAAAARGEANRIGVRSLAAGRARAQDRLRRGIDFWNTGNVEDALRQFRETLEADPTLADAHYWLGLAYEASGDAEGARGSLLRYLGSARNAEHAEEARQHLADLER